MNRSLFDTSLAAALKPLGMDVVEIAPSDADRQLHVTARDGAGREFKGVTEQSPAGVAALTMSFLADTKP